MPNKNKKINRAGKGSPGKAVDFVDNAGNVLPAGMGDQAPNNEFNATVQSPAAIYNPSFSYGGYTNGVSDSQQQFFDDATHHAIGRRNAHGTNLAEGVVKSPGMMNRAGRSTVSGITKNPMTMKGNFKNSSMETAARMFGNMPNPVPSPQQFNSGLRKASAEGKLNGNFKSAVDADTAGSPSKVIPIGAIVKGAQMVKGMIDKNK